MEKLNDLLDYIGNKFNFKERVYHRSFYLNKDKESSIHITLCVGDTDPLIRVYENGVLTDTLYMRKGKIHIEQDIDFIDDEIRLPNIEYISDITKKILDKYSENEIMVICFSDFHNICDIEQDIEWKVRDLRAKQKDYLNICKYVKLSKKEQESKKSIESLLFNI